MGAGSRTLVGDDGCVHYGDGERITCPIVLVEGAGSKPRAVDAVADAVLAKLQVGCDVTVVADGAAATGKTTLLFGQHLFDDSALFTCIVAELFHRFADAAVALGVAEIVPTASATRPFENIVDLIDTSNAITPATFCQPSPSGVMAACRTFDALRQGVAVAFGRSSSWTEVDGLLTPRAGQSQMVVTLVVGVNGCASTLRLIDPCGQAVGVHGHTADAVSAMAHRTSRSLHSVLRQESDASSNALLADIVASLLTYSSMVWLPCVRCDSEFDAINADTLALASYIQQQTHALSAAPRKGSLQAQKILDRLGLNTHQSSQLRSAVAQQLELLESNQSRSRPSSASAIEQTDRVLQDIVEQQRYIEEQLLQRKLSKQRVVDSSAEYASPESAGNSPRGAGVSSVRFDDTRHHQSTALWGDGTIERTAGSAKSIGFSTVRIEDSAHNQSTALWGDGTIAPSPCGSQPPQPTPMHHHATGAPHEGQASANSSVNKSVELSVVDEGNMYQMRRPSSQHRDRDLRRGSAPERAQTPRPRSREGDGTRPLDDVRPAVQSRRAGPNRGPKPKRWEDTLRYADTTVSFELSTPAGRRNLRARGQAVRDARCASPVCRHQGRDATTAADQSDIYALPADVSIAASEARYLRDELSSAQHELQQLRALNASMSGDLTHVLEPVVNHFENVTHSIILDVEQQRKADQTLVEIMRQACQHRNEDGKERHQRYLEKRLSQANDRNAKLQAEVMQLKRHSHHSDVFQSVMKRAGDMFTKLSRRVEKAEDASKRSAERLELLAMENDRLRHALDASQSQHKDAVSWAEKLRTENDALLRLAKSSASEDRIERLIKRAADESSAKRGVVDSARTRATLEKSFHRVAESAHRPLLRAVQYVEGLGSTMCDAPSVAATLRESQLVLSAHLDELHTQLQSVEHELLDAAMRERSYINTLLH